VSYPNLLTPEEMLAQAAERLGLPEIACARELGKPVRFTHPAVDPGEESTADRIVAYRSHIAQMLRCLAHVPPPAARAVDCEAVTAEDLPDGGICTHPGCGVDVLIPQDGAR
jgi:hypothetical protein